MTRELIPSLKCRSVENSQYHQDSVHIRQHEKKAESSIHDSYSIHALNYGNFYCMNRLPNANTTSD
jgi:hypothetical protein